MYFWYFAKENIESNRNIFVPKFWKFPFSTLINVLFNFKNAKCSFYMMHYITKKT